jgi:hypothetical protein
VHPRMQLVGILTASGAARWLRALEVAEAIESALAPPTIGDHCRIRLHVVGDEAMQRVGRGVGG